MRPAPRKWVRIAAGAPQMGAHCAQHPANGCGLCKWLAPRTCAQEFDGSDSGARPDEAVSWGKIRPEAKAVKARVDRERRLPASSPLRCAALG